MTAVLASPKEQILACLRQAALTEAQFSAFDGTIAKKLSEPPLPPRTPEFKEQLDQIYGLYKAAIESYRENLRTQYDLGTKVIAAITATDDLVEIQSIFTKYQTEMKTALTTHQTLETQIRTYEGQMIPLLPPNTLLIRK